MGFVSKFECQSHGHTKENSMRWWGTCYAWIKYHKSIQHQAVHRISSFSLQIHSQVLKHSWRFFSLQINHNGHSSAAQMAVAKGDASHIEVAWMQKDNKCDVISKFGMLSFCFRFGLLSFAMATEFRGDCGWYAGWSPSICGFASLLFCQYSSCRRCCHLQTGSSSNPATYKEAQLHISSDLDSFRTSWTCSFQLQEKHWI